MRGIIGAIASAMTPSSRAVAAERHARAISFQLGMKTSLARAESRLRHALPRYAPWIVPSLPGVDGTLSLQLPRRRQRLSVDVQCGSLRSELVTRARMFAMRRRLHHR